MGSFGRASNEKNLFGKNSACGKFWSLNRVGCEKNNVLVNVKVSDTETQESLEDIVFIFN